MFIVYMLVFFFFKQKTAYEMRISDWSSDVCSSDLDPKIWLPVLKDVLNKAGSTSKEWEIYRGDSFQLFIKDPLLALTIAIQIKAAIKTIKSLEDRKSVGKGKSVSVRVE